MSLKTTRRRMLALSAAIPAFSFLRSLDSQALGVQNLGKRFIFLYHPFGSSKKHWYGDMSETNFELGYTLNPLEEVKDDIIVCRNVDNKMGCDYWNQAPEECRGRGLNEVDQHTSGLNTMLSPYAPVDLFNKGGKTFSWPGGESLDWVLGRQMQERYKTPNDVLYFSPANSGGKDHANVYSTRKNAGGDLEYIEPETDPVAIYNKYLGAAQPGANMPSEGDVAAQEAAKRRQLMRGLVTDFAADEVSHYQSALPSELRPTLDAHLGELRALEQKLANAPAGGGAASAICSVVNPPDRSLSKVQVAKGGNVGNFRERAEVMSDLLVAAMSCDVTRVMNMSWWTFHGNCSPVNLEGTKAYGDLHLGLQHNRNGYTPQDTADAHQHVALQTARIIKKLKAIPEGDGTMLDNSVLLWSSCLGMDPFDGNGHHNKFDIPTIIAGGAGGALKTGRMIDFKRMNHVRVLSAITHLLDFPLDVVGGEPFYSEGGPAEQLMPA